MARRTKKVGTSGRFGPRYGIRVRKRIASIEAEKNKKHSCPDCSYKSVKRRDTGIWECRHCGLVFAGGAYTPSIPDFDAYKKSEAKAAAGSE